MLPLSISKTTESFKLPYYAVIFSTTRLPLSQHPSGPTYAETAVKMSQLASEQKGYLGEESVTTGNKNSTSKEYVKTISISYWKELEDIRGWKLKLEHLEAQKLGKEGWYKVYRARICKIEREYGFERL